VPARTILQSMAMEVCCDSGKMPEVCVLIEITSSEQDPNMFHVGLPISQWALLKRVRFRGKQNIVLKTCKTLNPSYLLTSNRCLALNQFHLIFMNLWNDNGY